MGCSIVRFSTSDGDSRWGVLRAEGVVTLSERYPSLKEFLLHGQQEARQLAISSSGFVAVDPQSLQFESPVTHPCQIVCQGKNYMAHLKETGTRPEDKSFNLLFYKASSTINRPSGPVCRPAGISLLDYELELGLVIGTRIDSPRKLTPKQLPELVAGLVIANDVSARDIQVPHGQWFRGKSFRGFCPVGPRLYLLDADEGPLLADLELKLWVNDELRQQANTCQMIYPPAETLSEVSGVMDLEPGDLLLTGTPGGVAMQAPGPWVQRLARIALSDNEQKRLFVKMQQKSARYLRNGDSVRATIRSADGGIDLGEQRFVVQG